MKKLITFPILLLFAGIASAQVFPVVTLKQSGALEKRINIAILPDGFTVAELPTFDLVADTIANMIFTQTPLKEYKNFFNVHCVNVPSAESGCDHPADATDVVEPVIPWADVNTYFDCTFDGGGTHRALVCNDEARAFSVLGASFPAYDQILMLANSFEYGGTGGPVATFSRDDASVETTLHELGHSFAGLADEYWSGWGAEHPNKTAETDTALIVWNDWLHVTGIGHFPYGATGEAATWFRPHQNCKMQYLNRPFCRVCQQTFIDRIYELVTPIDSVWPDNTGVAAYVGAPLTFKFKPIRPVPNTLKIKWKLNGVDMASTDTSVIISTGMLATGTNDLTAYVIDTTTLSRSYWPMKGYEFSVSWTISHTTGVIDVKTQNGVSKFFYSVYPVPVKDMLHIRCDNQTDDKEAIYTITDVSGRVVKKGTLALTSGKQDLRIDVAVTTPGTYVLHVAGKAIDITEKIIVE